MHAASLSTGPDTRPRPSPTPPVAQVRDAATALLPEFRAGDACFASPQATLQTRGVQATLDATSHHDLAHRATGLLDGCARGRRFVPLIGAIPFSDGTPAHLWVPEEAVFAAGRARRHIPAITPSIAATPRLMAHPDAARYIDNVAQALARIDAGTLEKVVMSRALTLDMRVDVPRLLVALIERNPEGYSFALDLDGADADAGVGAAHGAQRCLVGSSPELLLAKRHGHVMSNPLAGSVPRSSDPDEDARRAQALLRSAKDLREHAHVADAVARTLAPYCSRMTVPPSPGLRATPTMWHLSTEIHGELRDPATSSLTLALALHPTPAVCGHPTDEAKALIDDIEGFPRGMFTGLVGWCDASGDGEWAVSIRCAEIGADRATVYAGAGIVAGSDPHSELAETRAKMATMLQAMGLSHVAETLP